MIDIRISKRNCLNLPPEVENHLLMVKKHNFKVYNDIQTQIDI